MAGPAGPGGSPPPPPPPPAGGGRSRRARASGRRRWRLNRRWKRTLFAGVALFGVGVAAMGALVAYAALNLPDINSIGKATGTTKILDVHGNVIAELAHDKTSRHTVTIDQIAPLMQQATVAAEDRNFYSEGAFNPGRVLKAMVNDIILRRAAQGASTITQQLAKQAFFGASATKSPLRKVKEALLANELDSKYTKQQILELYLNITYYGENAYGIEDASTRYFNKHAKDLTLPEAALLAGLPEAPSYNDPYKNPGAAFARMHYVLGSLVATGAVRQADADAIDPLVGGGSATADQQAVQAQHQQALLADLQNGTSAGATGPAPHFVSYVQDELAQILGADNPELLQGSLVVNTSLDLNYQNMANDAVAKGVAKLASSDANDGALLMIDARTGNIQAWVGSAGYNNSDIAGQFDIVTAKRRPGSSFKPYVYAEGFISGAIKPSTTLQDTSSESQKLGNVPDFDNRFLGPITAAKALLLSRNVPTEQAMQKTGVDQVINFAYSLGIDQNRTPQAPNLSTAIGTSAVRMIDHTAAYAAFANGGHKVTARAILKISDGNGNVLQDFTQAPNSGDVMTPAQAWSITSILRNYQHQWNLHFKYDTAGKSGTTDRFVDAYYMTYTPDWVVATWTGHTSGTVQAEQPMNNVFGTSTGAAIAVPFVNGLPQPSAFTPVNGALSDCSQTPSGSAAVSGCPTPTSSATATASASPTATNTAPPFTLPPLPSITPSPSPSPSPSATPMPTPTPTQTAPPTGATTSAPAVATPPSAPTPGAAPAGANRARPPIVAWRRRGS